MKKQNDIPSERSPSELQIQAETWKTMWKEFPDLRFCYYHVPNESAYDNSQQTSSGVVPGIQDMHFLCDGRVWLIELKDDKGRLSRIQKVVHAQHKKQGFDTYVFRTAIECLDFLRHIVVGGDPIAFKEFVSEASVAEKYEEYLADWQANRQKNREARSK